MSVDVLLIWAGNIFLKSSYTILNPPTLSKYYKMSNSDKILLLLHFEKVFLLRETKDLEFVLRGRPEGQKSKVDKDILIANVLNQIK